MKVRTLLLGLVVVASSCHFDAESICTDSSTAPSVSITSGKLVSDGSSSVRVTGTISFETNARRVESVTVEGHPATAERENFAAWFVEIPAAVIEKKRSDLTALLSVSVETACGTTDVDDVVVETTAPAETDVPSLELEARFPTIEETQVCYLPLNRTASAELVVTADVSAVGVPVVVDPPTSVKLVGIDGSGTVVLQRGPGDAEARLQARASEGATAGSHFVVARAGEAADDARLAFAGSPTFEPAEATQLRGATTGVVVSTDGVIASCRVFSISDDDLRVELVEGPPATETGGVFEFDARVDECGQRALFEIGFDRGAGSEARAQIVCHDVFGQTGNAVVDTNGVAPLDVPGLEVTLTPDGAPDECYLPAGGPTLGRVDLSADGSAAGAVVTLSPSSNARIFGTEDVTLGEDSPDAVGTRYLEATAAGEPLFVVATASSAYSRSNALAVADEPTVSPAGGAITAGTSLVTEISTPGRLAACSALASHPTLSLARTSQDDDLLTTEQSFSDPDCGQRALITVGFAEEAPEGAFIRLECTDTYGQTASHRFTVRVPVDETADVGIATDAN